MIIQKKSYFLALIAFLTFNCYAQSQQSKRPVSIDNGKIFYKDGKKYLYGGENEISHFDISNSSLQDKQYHYGIGRERFPALIKPDFFSVEEGDEYFKDEARFLLLKKNGITKAYSVKDLTKHEVVNDEIDGEPIMAAYCILADLGAIYDRTLLNRKFTFALSGYTYYDPDVWDGMDGFVLWDRETESLWWPLIGEAVSGPLKGTKMELMNEKYWAQTTWENIKKNHQEARVLIPGQDFERPTIWPQYEDIKEINKNINSGKAISPRWGENISLNNKNEMIKYSIPLEEAKAKLKKSGKNYIEPFKHGTLQVGVSRPVGIDKQQPHDKDEVYVIISGSGIFFCNGETMSFSPGDVLFVPAGVEHRFEDFSENFSSWVFFYGPKGGEKP